MAATATACIACCSVGCSVCCCICEHICGCGMNFEDLIKTPPTADEVKRFLEALIPGADPDGEPDTICFCLPKSIVCCLPRCCCPCIFSKPDPVVTVKTRDVIQASKIAADGPSFLGDERAMRYTARIFEGRDNAECRLEYMSAGMVLLSVGSIKEKLASLFEAFQFCVGGVFNKEALERTLRSIMKTVIDISKRVAQYISGAAVPGGKAVGIMLTTLNGTIGSYFIHNRVNKMLQRDVDKDGTIDYEEFEACAMRRDSLIRKSLAWVERKTAIIRGERSEVLVGKIKIDGEEVWARVYETEMDANQCVEYWKSEDHVGQKEHRVGRISLQEPCAIDDGEDESDNIFTIVDADKKRWEIECLDKESFFSWYDAIDEKCDARLEADDLKDDGKAGDDCPAAVMRMLR